MIFILKLAVLYLHLPGWSTANKRGSVAVDRSYQLTNFPLGAQGIQYYSSASPALLYPNVPATVYIPGQVGLLNLPPGIAAPHPSLPPPSESTSTFKPPARPSYSVPQQQASSSFTIEQSVDLTDSKLPAAVSTYGPPKALDFQTRKPHSSGTYRTYYRPKGNPYPVRSSRPTRPLVYTHFHKGHLHTHHVPPSESSYKFHKPTYLPPPTTTAPTPSTETPHKVYNHHAHPPSVQTTAQSSSHGSLAQFSGGHGDLTQAVIGQQGVINNYDTNLPVKIPQPKPNLLEVKEILKNADLHFVDVEENRPTMPSSVQQYSHEQPQQPPQYPQTSQHYQSPHIQQQEWPGLTFSYHQDKTHPIMNQQLVRPYAELYDHRFQNNHLDHDLGSSETIKVPVAIFKGVHPVMFPMSMTIERSDEDSSSSSSESLPADFTPSKSTSDWIPMTGGVPAFKQQATRNLNQFGDEYFSDLTKKPTKSLNSKLPKPTQESFFLEPTVTNAHQNFPVAQKLVGLPESSKVIFKNEGKRSEKVGDIISGKIPGDHNPFGTLGLDNGFRKGNSVKGVSSANVSDGSNLVVSSVIKFSR